MKVAMMLLIEIEEGLREGERDKGQKNSRLAQSGF